MAANKIISSKRLQIDKANASMVIFLAAASFVIVFSLLASRALLGQRSYQTRVIKEKKKALTQLKANNQAASQLANTYKTFVSTPDNIIGGNPTGSGDRDGDNARIVLDALPSKYDFPALATSLDKILNDKKYKINSISGTDDELAQSTPTATAAQPVEIPFQVSISGSFDAIQGLLNVFQNSIRPIYLHSMDLSGSDNNLTINVTAGTYYQPEKKINITTKVVK
ncbi:MAG: hypothetical protein V4702_05025 [Patescibacteria group bacterium]